MTITGVKSTQNDASQITFPDRSSAISKKSTANGVTMMTNTNPTQAQRVLDYIQQYGSITQLEALQDIGVMRLAARISDLRKQGERIGSKMINVENRYGETCRVKSYFLGGADG